MRGSEFQTWKDDLVEEKEQYVFGFQQLLGMVFDLFGSHPTDLRLDIRSIMNPPPLTPEQRRQALVKAAAVRKGRAEIKADLSDRRLSMVELLERTDDPLVGGMKVVAALSALPGLGKKRTSMLMERVGILENRRLRGLGKRQREALIRELS